MKLYKSKAVCIISAVLTAFAQIENQWFIAYISLIPLYIGLLKCETIREYIKSTSVFFLTYTIMLMSFLMTLYDIIPLNKLLSILLCAIAVIGLSVIQSAVMVISVTPAYRVRKNKALFITVFSFCYAMGQWLIEMLPVLAFPWARLENALVYHRTHIMSAELFGGLFVCIIIVAVNGLFSVSVINARKLDILKSAIYFTTAIALFGANHKYGMIRLEQKSTNDASRKKIEVLVIQTSIEGIDKNKVSQSYAIEEIQQLINDGITPQTKLIVLPETAISSVNSESTQWLLEISKDTPIIVGGFTNKNDKSYNSMIALASGEVSDCYTKSVLVPFGEYIPFGEMLGFSNVYPHKCEAPVQIGNDKYACMICVETLFSDILKPQIQSGGKAIVVSTNDSWFKNSFARKLHFNNCIMRAVEYERYVVRSGNCGISAIISDSGYVMNVLDKKKSGNISATVSLSEKRTLFSYIGNAIITPPLMYSIWFYLSAIFKTFIRNSIP